MPAERGPLGEEALQSSVLSNLLVVAENASATAWRREGMKESEKLTPVSKPGDWADAGATAAAVPASRERATADRILLLRLLLILFSRRRARAWVFEPNEGNDAGGCLLMPYCTY